MSLGISKRVEQFIYEVYRELPLEGEVSAVDVRELVGGYHNHVFVVSVKTTAGDFGEFVLKVNRIKKLAYKMQSEFEVLKFLRDEPFAPSVFYFSSKPRILGSPALLEEYIQGGMVGRAGALTKKQFERIASLMANIHSNTFKKYGLFPPSRKGTFFDVARDNMERTIREFYGGYLRNLKNAPSWIVRLRPKVDVYIKKTRGYLKASRDHLSAKRFFLLHGDFGIGNMLARGGKLVLIDWENARAGDSASEMVYFFIHSGIRGDLESEFLDLYKKKGGLVDDSFLERFKIYATIMPLGPMLWALERASGNAGGGLEDLSLMKDLRIKKESVPYGELLKRRLVKLEEALGVSDKSEF